ncbi:MAG: glycogen debranching protein GlgX [Calditrichaceae bacterium]|nr:glycogen debranching protein GlgX [Calditrichaceae bacterium]MBN2709265.1 glycogen debranching protein GlgX [Calditrichaceae bacterium]
MKNGIRRSRGRPFPFGAIAHKRGINFALYAPLANEVSLIIYHPGIVESISEFKLNYKTNRTGQIWHIQLEGLSKKIRYGYRVNCPDQLSGKIKTDPRTILLDPYAKATAGGELWGEPQKIKRQNQFHTFRLGAIPDNNFNWEDDCPLNIALRDTIIYEVHVRGFTKHNSSGVKKRGTFEGLIEKIPYLKQLGITAIELMPVTDFDETHPGKSNPQTGERLMNYWGYDPITFFAPKEAYAHNPRDNSQVNSFKKMVKAFHKAGIEIILDMVFNHTGEGNHLGPVFNFKSLGSHIFYLIDPITGEFINYSGCGNTINCNQTIVKEIILDSLRYWVTEMHVDGFRFDLASILGRGRDGSVLNNPPLIERITEDPILANTKLIAEAWDAGGLYQVGTFPGGQRWMEWNGLFRDDVRRFLRGDYNMIPRLATRLAGSSDLYQDDGREPFHSVNFITCHDGFTLFDLVSYNRKHNEANGEDNKDGSDQNFNWNCGAEGLTDKPEVIQLREKQIRNFAVILLLSQGVPMLYAGDELMNSKGGNNNTYCQDNETGWLDWDITPDKKKFMRFIKILIHFRKKHPNLRRSNFIVKENSNGIPEMSWHGYKQNQPDWSEKSRILALRYAGTDLDPCNIFIMINGSQKSQRFELPQLNFAEKWHMVINTANKPPHDIYHADKEPVLKNQKSIILRNRSIMVLISKVSE